MRFTTPIACLALVIATLGMPTSQIHKRDLSNYLTSISYIESYANQASEATNNYTSPDSSLTATGVFPLVATVGLLGGGFAYDIPSYGTLSDADATTLTVSYESMGSDVEAMASDLISVKSLVVRDGYVSNMLIALEWAQAGLANFTAAIIVQEPTDTLSAAGAEISAALQATIDEYST